jgi:hypothetical protein
MHDKELQTLLNFLLQRQLNGKKVFRFAGVVPSDIKERRSKYSSSSSSEESEKMNMTELSRKESI